MSDTPQSGPGRNGEGLERIRTILAMIGLVGLTLVGLEVGSRAFLFAVHKLPKRGTSKKSSQPVVPAALEGASYDFGVVEKEEKKISKEIYRPFTVWSTPTFAGEMIHVDEHGHRATSYSSEGADALQIWMFGGSTTWGQGAPDAQTIPSHVAKILNQEWGIDADVRNFGEIGYVSTQENVAVIRQLQLGRRPDFVLFLDGVNDAPVAALWPDVLGAHMDYNRIRDRFEQPGRRDVHPVVLAVRSSGVMRLANWLRKKLGLEGIRPNPLMWDLPVSAEEIQRRGEIAARLWLDNYRSTAALGRAYDFVPIYFLQPSLHVGEKPLHPAERELIVSENENEAKKASMEVYAEMRRAVRERLQEADPAVLVYDISDLFRETTRPVYYDYVHMSGAGYGVVAEEIVAVLANHLCADGSAGISEHTRSQLVPFCDQLSASVSALAGSSHSARQNM